MVRVCLLGRPSFLKEAEFLPRSVKVLAAGQKPDDILPMCHRADMVIVEAEMPDAFDKALSLAHAAPVFLAMEDAGLDAYRRAVKQGLRGVVRVPLDAEELEEIAEEISDEHDEEEKPGPRGSQVREIDDEFARDDAPERDRYVAGGRRARVARQEVIALYSSKGGVGKTTLAVNLAAVYAQSAPDLRVAVVDLDPHARVCVLLQIGKTPVTIEDWDSLQGPFDSRLVRHALGMYVLPGLRRAINKEALTDKLVSSVLDFLRRAADVVIVDCAPDLEDATIVALESCTRALIVCTPDIQTFKDLNRTAKYITLLRTEEDKFNTVLNRVGRRLPWSMGQIERWLPYPLIAKIPEDPAVQDASNHGQVAVQRRTPFANAMYALAAELSPALFEGAGRRGLFGWLLRKGVRT